MLNGLQQGQKILILRYGKQIVEECIKLHQEIIEDLGYVWFGKLGTAPGKNSIDSMLDEEQPKLILYARGEGYLCSVEEVSYNTPTDGYPEYYQKELFEKLIYPSIYFKLITIEKIEISDLDELTVVSSGNSALNTLMHSMSSFLFVSYGRAAREEIKPKKSVKPAKREPLSDNDCIYRKDGHCGLKGFVSYQFECERPSSCMRQKR